MKKPGKSVLPENRRDPRVGMATEVTITFDEGALIGPGHNISAQGIYFTTTRSLRVHVGLAGSERKVAAELVRVESMGNGIYGIAVRFLEPVEAPEE
jgi:hypothetical protein